MNWLYSIVFAGLMFSSNNDKPVKQADAANVETPAATVVQGDEIEKFEQSYPISAKGRVSVSNVNGSIVVEAWDKNEVHLAVTKIADSKETLADVELRIDSRPDSFSVETDYKDLRWSDKSDRNHKRKLEVQFRLSVPRTAVLDEIETVNGSVTVSNFVNTTKVSAVNGTVTATNLRGAANLSTVNGKVLADFNRLESGSRINLSTVNGEVSLTIPSDSNATIKADSLNGNITNDFGLRVRKGEYVGRDLHGRIGSGDVQIKLNSVNGGLSIGKKNDGRSPSPATNLLPAKGKDDDWDHDTDGASAVSTVRINREVAKAVRESQRETRQAVAEAQKQIGKAKPVLPKIEYDKLAKLKIVDAEKIQAEIRSNIGEQNAALARMRTANWLAGAPIVVRKSNSFAVKDIPKVVIDAKGCGVKVRGWDKQEVKYVLTEIGETHSRKPITVNENRTNGGLNLTVVNGSRAGRYSEHDLDMDEARIEVYVPRRSNLKIVTNGEIRLDGVSGDIELVGESEAINVRDVDGKLSLSATDGQVRVIGFKGELESRTTDGDVFLEGDFSKLSARATDATIMLTLPENANATLQSNTEIGTEGVDLTRENEKNWRIGSGGAKYNFNFTDGRLVVRSAALVNTY